jgi:hypothetical protein
MILKIIKENIIGIIIGVLGFFASIIAYFFSDKLDAVAISYRWTLFAIMIFVIIIVMEYVIIFKLKDRLNNHDINKDDIFQVRIYNKEIGQFILVSNSNVQINTVLGVYYKIGDYEIIFGLAKIVADTGRAYQMQILKTASHFKETFPTEYNGIMSNDNNYIGKIVVKYLISEELIDLVQFGGIE